MSITALAATAVEALTALSAASGELGELNDSAFLALARSSASIRRLSDAQTAAIAGETARRSTRERGHDGLAQRLGYRTPQALVQATTGSTAAEAMAAVRVGSLSPDSPIASAIGSSLSISAANAITHGLGEPTAQITAVQLADAAVVLIEQSRTLDADRLLRVAREMRDDLDAAGVADREAVLRGKRSLRVVKQADGLSRLVWVMDPETAASVTDLYDRATSPRRGGPRFVSGSSADLAARIADDERTTEQLASDTFLQLVCAGADTDSSSLLGSGAPVLRVIVNQSELDHGASADSTPSAGRGFLEGQSAPVSIATVERLRCSGGVAQAVFDRYGQPLDISPEQRLFTRRQRDALALRDGGCMFDDCTAPPSWTEAHHIRHYSHGGKTEIANGILLCRFHHLLLHNNGWDIIRERDQFWLTPPPNIDPNRAPRLLRSKTPALRQRA